MKSTVKLLIFVITLLAVAASAYAQSPREQLNQMVAQLQKTPSDSALREKIIKLAPTMKPSPALPDTAVAFEGRAQFAFKSAKSEGDYLAAAQEYEKAVAIAPWVLGYYADLCMIYEKAGKLEDAKRHCGFYLLGLTDPAQTTDVKRRIAGLEFGIEKANSPQAREATLLQKVEGARFVDDRYRAPGGRLSYDDIFEIKNGILYRSIRIYSLGSGNTRMISFYGHDQPGLYSVGQALYRDDAFTITSDGITCVYRIRSDGKALLTRCSNWLTNAPENDIPRQ